MILNPNAQHRVKHFDLLLAREIALLERECEQNLITYQNLENSIRRDNDRMLNSNRKNNTLPLGEIHHEHIITLDHSQKQIYTNNFSNEKSVSSYSSSNNSQCQTDEKESKLSHKYRRHCLKPQRLPPIIKATNVPNRRKPSTTNDLHWMGHFQQSNKRKDSVHDALSKINEELPKTTLPELTPIEKQVHAFMNSLPTYTGTQRGFDNFAPSSLYSIRAPVAMK